MNLCCVNHLPGRRTVQVPAYAGTCSDSTRQYGQGSTAAPLSGAHCPPVDLLSLPLSVSHSSSLRLSDRF